MERSIGELGAASEHVMYSKRRNKAHEKGYTKKGTQLSGRPPSRRDFFKIAGIGIGATILAAAGLAKYAEQQQSQADQIYQHWELLKNQAFSKELYAKIAEDLQKSKYPGFAQAGEILAQLQENPASFTVLTPPLTETPRIVLLELVRDWGAVGQIRFGVLPSYEDVPITDVATGAAETKNMVRPQSTEIILRFENSLALGSTLAKRYLLTKEVSHIAYLPELKRKIVAEAAALKTISPENFPPDDFLFMNAICNSDANNPSGFGFAYDNCMRLLDGAGYWHVMPALGLGIYKGEFTDEDLNVFGESVDVFYGAVQKGLLIDKGSGVFEWAEGVGPFSQAWFDIISPLIPT